MQRRNRFLLLILSTIGAVVLLAGGTVWAITTSPTDATSTEDTTENEAQPSNPPTVPDASTNPTDPAGTTPSESSDESFSSEEQLALEAAEIMTTWEAAEDFNQTASELRARHLMTEERAAEVTAPKRPATGEEWRVAGEREATSEPTVELNTHTDSRWLSVTSTWRWTAEGYNPIYSDQTRAFYFTFTEENGELKIHDYTWETLN